MATHSNIFARMYSAKGGLIRFGYSVDHLLQLVDTETQFAGRNIRTQEGHTDLTKVSGPDDKAFVVRGLKNAIDTIDTIIPRHTKPVNSPLVSISDNEVAVTLLEAGVATPTAVKQVNELIRNYLMNLIVQMWFARSGVGSVSQSYGETAMLASRNIQRVLLHSFRTHRAQGKRFPEISLYEPQRLLKDKYLGAYAQESDIAEIYGVQLDEGDIAYVEDENDYIIYNGATWDKYADAFSSADGIDPTTEESYPHGDQGDIYKMLRSGKIGENGDRYFAGDMLICISNNQSENYRDDLSNFIVLQVTKQSN